jgi:hypothetical protein
VIAQRVVEKVSDNVDRIPEQAISEMMVALVIGQTSGFAGGRKKEKVLKGVKR